MGGGGVGGGGNGGGGGGCGGNCGLFGGLGLCCECGFVVSGVV